jgi:RecQ mediated genome instability protein
MSNSWEQELASRYGLRNLSPAFVRQNNQRTPLHLESTIELQDICDICSGTLPFEIGKAHAISLSVPVLVQVEDVINMCSEDDPRKTSGPSTLLMRLTDGRQSFAAIELLPLGGVVTVKTVPGQKYVLLKGALIRRGRFMLSPETIKRVGRPSGNVWGNLYASKISEALLAAGIKPADAVSFDALAPAAEVAPIVGPITGLGGIADITPNDADDLEEEAFWDHAMQHL